MNALIHTQATETIRLSEEPTNDSNAMLECLDTHFTLSEGSHRDVTQYRVYFGNLLAHLSTGRCVGLAKPSLFEDFGGDKECPSSITLSNQQKMIEICF